MAQPQAVGNHLDDLHRDHRLQRTLIGKAHSKLPPNASAPGLVPRQLWTDRPFSRIDRSSDIDGDLALVEGEVVQACRMVTPLRGCRVDAEGAHVPGALAEIWQCDATSPCCHPRHRRDGCDRGFQGRGRLITGTDGSYPSRTIHPVPYPGRTSHIRLALAAPGQAPPLVAHPSTWQASRLTNAAACSTPPRSAPGDAVLPRLKPADRIAIPLRLAARGLVIAARAPGAGA